MKKIFQNGMISASLKSTIIACLISLGACDKVEVDPDLTEFSTDSQTSTVFVAAGNNTLIDLAAKLSPNQPVLLKVTASTTKGSLTNVAGGLVQYSPQAGIMNARDGFEYTLTNQSNQVVQKDSVIIVVSNDPTTLPNGIYTFPDYVFGVSSNASVTIPVLQNDLLTKFTFSDLTLSIYTPDSTFPPYEGSATVNGLSITYTPNSGFKGADKVVYKITLKSDPTVFSFGLVYLTTEAPCSFTVAPDRYVSSEEFTQVRIPITANDQLCQAVISYNLTITTAPRQGIAYIESDELVYRSNSLATNRFVDSLRYTVTIDGVSKSAPITISVNTNSGSCRFEAVNDALDLTSSTATTVTIDVLQNDSLCGNTVTLEIFSSALHGAASITTTGNGKQVISYTPNPQDVADDKILYKVKTGQTESIAGVAIKRVN